MAFEVYLDSAKGLIYNPDTHYGSRKSNVVTMHGPSLGHGYGKQFGVRLLPNERERFLLEMLEKAALREGTTLRVYDVSRFWHAVRAYFVGVKDIPAVRIGRNVFTTGRLEEVSKAQLEKALNSKIDEILASKRRRCVHDCLNNGFPVPAWQQIPSCRYREI